MTNFPRNGFNTLFISLINVLGALVSQNGIISHSYIPSFILKVVFQSSPSLILIWWYPLIKSILVKYVAPLKKLIKSSILVNENMYLMVMLLMALKSMQILHSHPFFRANTTSNSHRLSISLINPLSNKPYTFHFNSTPFFDVILCDKLVSKIDLRIKLI